MNARREWLDAALGRYIVANPQQAADTVTVIQFMRWLSTERVPCPSKLRNGQLCDREEGEGHSGLHHWPSAKHTSNTKPCDRCGQLEAEHKDIGFCRDYWVNRRANPIARYFDKRPEIHVAGLTGDERRAALRERYGCTCNINHTKSGVVCGICRKVVPDCASTRGLECDCPGVVCRAGSR